MSFWAATVITNLLSAIPWIGRDLVEFVWGGFSVITAAYNNNMKTLLDAGITPIYGTRYLLSKYNLFNLTIIVCIGYLMVSLIKNNVTIRVTRSLSAGVCKLICRYFSSTAPQRLNAKDMAWLVGFVEGPFGPRTPWVPFGPRAKGDGGRPTAARPEVPPPARRTKGPRSLGP